MARRRRARAGEMAPRPSKGLPSLVLLLIGLGLIVAFKASMGDETASFLETLTVDPDLELPTSVTELRADAGAPADARPEGSR